MKTSPDLKSMTAVAALGLALGITLMLCHPAEAGLVSYWAADGNSNDSAGPNHGTAVNTVNYSTGQFGQAFALAKTGHINVANPVAGGLESVTGFTIAAWIFRDGVGSPWGTAPVANLRTTANTSGFTLEEVYQQSNTIGFVVNTTGGIAYYSTHGVTASGWEFGRFYHIAATFDAATNSMVLYRDGQVVATRNDLPGTVMIANSSSMFQIGRNIDNGSRWDGLIDDVRFYNRPLNQAEIQDDFARIASSSLALKISQSGGNLDFEWNSTAGKRYDLLTNTELTTPIMDWPVLNDGETVHEAIPSAGVVTTLTGVPASGPRRFFALREYDAPPP